MSSSQTLDSTPPPASPSPKKRGRKKAGEGTPTPTPEKKPPEKTATPVDRPSRERKTVERYSASAPRRASASKAVPIKEGSGTKLKDIPNVTFKLSKRKPDERLQNLHKVLFGKRCKAHYLKRNIMQFSGFVWTDDEEKQKARLTEKLSKFVKDDLLDFCDVLDVSIGSKTSTKKVDVMTLLMEFLESPHVTRDLILEDEQKSAKKRKRTKKASESSSAKKQRRQKLDKTEGEDNQEEPVDEDEEKEEVDAEGESASDDDDQEKSEAEEEDKEEPLKEPKVSTGKQKKGATSMDIEDDKPAQKSTPVKCAKGEGTPRKNAKHISTTPQKAPMKKGAKGGLAHKVELTSRVEVKSKNKKSKTTKNKDPVPKDKKSNQKQVSKTKSSSKPSNKEKDKGKGVKKASVSPTKEELYAVVTDILKVVDFNTATLADILKQLGTHFGTDLMSRKTEVKGIIEDVISNMSDDDESEEEGDEEKEAEEDGKKESQQDDQEEAPQEKADTEKESEKVEDVTESSDKDGEGKKGEDNSP